MKRLVRLSEKLGALHRRPMAGLISSRADLDVYCGHEQRTPADHYYWDGRRRGSSPRRSSFLLQYTLDGFGTYAENNRTWKVLPGQAFTAAMPSRHVYCLPDESSSWTFFWLMIRHTYVVQRLIALHRAGGPIIAADPDSELLTRMVELYIAVRGRTDDAFRRERRLFDLMIACERAVHAMRHAPTQRDRMLERVQRYARDHELTQWSVDGLATEFGISRSNFSHQFRGVTGHTPAAYLRDLRLENARDQLLSGDAPLKSIALACGFADSTHFTKAFRRRFGFTPGAFRSQLGGPA